MASSGEIWENLCWLFVILWIWKGWWRVQEIFSNSVTLGEAGAGSAKGQVHWPPCCATWVAHEDLMELEAQREDEERQKKKQLKNQRDSPHRKWPGDFLWGGTVSLRPRTKCRMVHKGCISRENAISPTVSSMMRKRAFTQTSHDYFSRCRQRLNPARNQNLSLQQQAWVTSQLASISYCQWPFSSTTSTSSPSLQSYLFLPVHSMPAVVVHYCNFQSTVLYDENGFILYVFKCIICVKSIINLLQYSTIQLIVLVGYPCCFVGLTNKLDSFVCGDLLSQRHGNKT